MYECPIEIVETATKYTSVFDEEKDLMILKAVQGVDVNVDKDELLKALTYDRQQYNKGFEDGVKEFAKHLVDISETGFISVVDLVDYAADMLGEGGNDNA